MNNDFEDPLENYDPKVYKDSIEKALAEEQVSRIQHAPHSRIQPNATVAEAIEQLASNNIACLVVEQQGVLQGVFTHRDVLMKVALNPKALDQPVREVMTPNPIYLNSDDAAAAALTVMAVSGYRHAPIVGADNRVVGVISPQRVTRFLSSHFNDN